MSNRSQVILFGDLTCDAITGLRVLVTIKDNPLLNSFFERVAFVLRAEIGSLPYSQRGDFVQFINFPELLARAQRLPCLHPALEKALACTYQFGCFISHYTASGRPYPLPRETRLVGLCTGSLTATAVSCCQTITDLIPLAVHTVLVAFRTGLCVSEVRKRVDPQNDSPAAWSVLIPGLQGDAAVSLLAKYNKDKGLPATSVAYVSTYSNTGVTLSGPPNTLSDLLSSGYLPKTSSLKIPIHAPYHAPHLYSSRDIHGILKGSSNTEFSSYSQHIPIVSSAGHQWGDGATYKTLLEHAIEEILLKTLRLDKILVALSEDLKDTAERACVILPIATSATQGLVTDLKKHGLTKVTVETSINLVVTNDKLPSSGRLDHSKLAILGYSGRYPDANNNEEYWQLLYEGRDVASFTPSNRWDVKTHVDPTLKKKNTSGTPYGCWLKDPGLFDAKFFMLSPREAPQVDPAQRLALMTAYEAMENAGFVPDSTTSSKADRIGVFYGTTSNDWGETNTSQCVDTYYIPGSCRAFIPGRQNYFFKFSGPSYSVDTACSSGLAALHIACNALWRGDIDTAICGGTNVLTNPDITAGLDRGHFLSKTGNCKTFDDDADGYCRGEGVGTLVVKRLEDAMADNDPIVGIIDAAYTNHSAEAESITRPHAGAQKAIFEKVLTSAGVHPFSVGYVEMHGTGTQAGDAREMESVLSTFAPDTINPRTDAQRLFLGSAKANVGHGESVSGINALIKSLMMMERNEIPPHCGIKNKINTKFPTDLKERNVHIAMKPTPWPRPEKGVRRIMVNNFSAAGGNSSVLIEDPPIIHKSEASDPRSIHLVAVSAKSSTALVGNIKSLMAYIVNEKPSLASLAYTTTARRVHHPFRAIVSGSELAEIHAKLENKLTSPGIQTRTRAAQRVVFAFTGQGSQYLGMGHELLKFSDFRQDIDRFDAIVQGQGYPSVLPLLEQGSGDITSFAPLVVQLGTTCIQMAMARLWRSWGMEPCAVVGHSLGEYAALNIAGALSEADAIFLVGKRAQLLQERVTQNTHAMLAVNASDTEIVKLCEGLKFEISCKNAPSETVLSGTDEQIDEIIKRLSSTNLKKTKLQVPFAFHSLQMQPILAEFEHTARIVRFHDLKVPILSPLLGEILTTNDALSPTYLARHCRETVNFTKALEKAKSDGRLNSAIWIEVGAHPILSNLLKANLGSQTTTVPTLQRNKDPWKTLSAGMEALYKSGADIRWSEYHRDFIESLSVLRLPSYSWDLQEYWIQYVNDWSLYKGDAMFLQASPGLSTTCVHEIVEEKMNGSKLSLIGQTDILRDDADPFVRGHRVNNVPLVTRSFCADMLFVLGEYLRKKNPDLKGSLVEIQDMDSQRPLTTKSKGKGPQLLQCRIELDSNTRIAAVEFWSVNSQGKSLVKHVEARMAFSDAKAAHTRAQQDAQGILGRIDDLAKRVDDDDGVQKITGNTAYRLVSSLSAYDSPYRGISTALLDSPNYEAVGTVKFGHPEQGGIYHINPYLLDNFCQPALIAMNVNDQADLTKEVYVNHGWESLHFFKPLSMDKVYRSHAKMSGPAEDFSYCGNIMVFEGDEVVAVCRGFKAERVQRRLMDFIFRPRDDSKVATGAPTGGTLPDVEQIPTLESAETIVDSNPASWQAALKIISEESGVPVSELAPEASFSDLGVDSLLSLLCASRFREELGLLYESSIFMDCPTIKSLEAFWKKGAPQSTTVSGADEMLDRIIVDARVHEDKSSDGEKSSETSSQETNLRDSETSLSSSPQLAASSLLLQGNPALPATVKTLFLLPDGSGSCSSYAALPRIHPSIAVVGVNSPFMKIPEQFTCDMKTVCAMYVDEIRRRQPHGPYTLGGWSGGGIFAYNIAQQLIADGEEVTELVLIDSPVPLALENLPKRYYKYCDEIGVLGEVNGIKKDPPKWLISHFEACVNCIHGYNAIPIIPESAAPKTYVIWASDAIDQHLEHKFERRPDDPAGLDFLLAARTDFGPSGWETLLPEDNMDFGQINGANHFSMMKGEFAKQLSEMIEGFLMNGN